MENKNTHSQESANLVLFIDALPYESRDHFKKFLDSTYYFYPMRPTFGYSINLKSELFANKNPDEVGFFNEWSYDKSSKYKHEYQTIQRLFSFLGKIHPLLDGFLHKVFIKICGENIFRIPFKLLKYFSKNGTEAYNDEFEFETVLSKYKVKKVLYNFFNGHNRDEEVFKNLNKEIDSNKNLFGAFSEVDHNTHILGVNNPEHTSLMLDYSMNVNNLLNTFLHKHPNGKILLFSDHGMSNPDIHIDLDLEKNIGQPSEDTFVYFMDATLSRIWTFNHKTHTDIVNYLATIKDGQILSDEQRDAFNLTDKKFGDILFALNDNALFCPSFFGRKPVKGMHGYLPENDSQIGMVMTNFPINQSEELRPKDVYMLMDKMFSNDSSNTSNS